MTEYFEIHHRDGPARYGDLRLTESVPTPACADDIVVDAGSLWTHNREISDINTSVDLVTILPHRAFPAGTHKRIQDSFAAAEASSDAVSSVNDHRSGDPWLF